MELTADHFSKLYASMSDDELGRLAFSDQLTDVARKSLETELSKRSMHDLTKYAAQRQELVDELTARANRLQRRKQRVVRLVSRVHLAAQILNVLIGLYAIATAGPFESADNGIAMIGVGSTGLTMLWALVRFKLVPHYLFLMEHK